MSGGGGGGGGGGGRADLPMCLCIYCHFSYYFYSGTSTNPNSLGPELVQISVISGLMKQYIWMGELSLFYLLHTKITMNIIEMAVQINEGSD